MRNDRKGVEILACLAVAWLLAVCRKDLFVQFLKEKQILCS